MVAVIATLLALAGCGVASKGDAVEETFPYRFPLEDGGTEPSDATGEDAGEEEEDAGTEDAGAEDAGSDDDAGSEPQRFCSWSENWTTTHFASEYSNEQVGTEQCQCGHYSQHGAKTDWKFTIDFGGC